ncbi:MAG: hypothetical protein NTZ93_00005, partial [Candidatus Beckwithbacteria bacterium]|nr:hypothetical protein [Candidatus Beckwithbacteria bacterium]
MNINYQAYENYLKGQKLPAATIKRKLSSLRKFANFLNQSPLKKETKLVYTNRSEAVRIPAGNFTKYLLLAVLILFSTALGIFGYRQIFKEAGVGQAYPQAPSPTTPNRYLSFQARLTDSSDNPIGVPTDMRFIIYNADAPASGSAKLWEEQRYVDPDQDGIFSVTLGTETAIPSSLFTENPNLWLGVTVQRDPEATPRQRIATVAYALNAETLQGFPPSASASADQIPVLTQEGDLVLAQANPMVYSSSGTFSIKGQILTLNTATGTGGDIQIAPDGTGNLDINLSSTIQNALDITNAGQTSGHLISGYLGNNTATGDLLNLSAGSTAVEKFTVDTSGNTMMAGNLEVNGGNIGLSTDTDLLGLTNNTLTVNGTAVMTGFKLTTSPTANFILTSDTNGVGTWQAAPGGISGSGTQYYLPIWSSSTALGNSSIYESSSNVGIGTTDPLQKLDLVAGSSYGINGASVLNATTLGTNVVTSSLTTVGVLGSGSIAAGFGTISTGNTITT